MTSPRQPAPIRWGILGTGKIATKFAYALKVADGAVLGGVGSRQSETALRFAAEHPTHPDHRCRAHGSYAELAADPEIDAVYIATPHSRHCEDAILCLEAGKHVLCEKPLALNADQARRMVAAARRHDRLLMEAMWSRFLPSLQRVHQLVTEGAIGDLRLLAADFAIAPPFDPHGRVFDPGLGGGALLDLGVYTISLGCWLFGMPSEITGTAHLGPTEVDDESAFVLRHAGGRFTLGYQSLRVETTREAVIRGTTGAIRLTDPWWGAREFYLESTEGEDRHETFSLRGQGYTHMAEAFMDLIRAGERDNQVICLEESVQIMEVMDTLRHKWGLRYPGE